MPRADDDGAPLSNYAAALRLALVASAALRTLAQAPCAPGTFSANGLEPCTPCGAGAYSYGGARACAACAGGAALVSPAAGCVPSSTTAGPADTAFYLSGSAAEGVGAFSTISAPSGISYSTSVFGVPNGSLVLANGSFLSADGSGAPASLPSAGNVSWSSSAWVKCQARNATRPFAAVLEWGAASPVGFDSLMQAASLDVGFPPKLAPLPNSGVVSTFAGNGQASIFAYPAGLAIDELGVVFVADHDNQRILRMSSDGVVSTLAGGMPGFADGQGVAARFDYPNCIAIEPLSGTLVVTDFQNNRVRLVTPSGLVTTLAGDGPSNHDVCKANDGLGTAARFCCPSGIALMSPSREVVVVADQYNHRIRLVSLSGEVTTFAGTSRGWQDGVGSQAMFDYPYGVAVVPSSGAIIVSEYGGGRIRHVTPDGMVTTLAGPQVGPTVPRAWVDGTGTSVRFAGPAHITILPGSGVILVADSLNNRIRMVRLTTDSDSDAQVTTLAGSSASFADGTGEDALFSEPLGLAFDATTGSVVVSDSSNNRLRRIAPPTSACDSTWHHVALTYAPGDPVISLLAFLDGALWLSSAALVALPPASVLTLRIGWSGNLSMSGGSLFAGELSELRIYNRTLSSAEVAALSQPPLADYVAAFANTVVSPYCPVASSKAYVFTCAAGFAGPASVLQRKATDGSWGWAGGMTPACSACHGDTHSYGGPSCSACGAGATFVSATSSCMPSTMLTAGPTDTAFYLSGSAAEGVEAFSTISAPSGISYSTSVFGVPNGSLVLANGSFLSAAGGGAPASLPSAGNVSWSLSSWVKCAEAMDYPWLAVLEWGAAGDGVGGADEPVAALIVAASDSMVGRSVEVKACDSTWHHVALTYDPAAGPTSMLAFIDGAYSGYSPALVALPPMFASTLRIGWSGDLKTNGGSPFVGALSELRIYNRTLSSSEVVTLSQPPLSAFSNVLVAPPEPTAGAVVYVFSCAGGCFGNGAVLQRSASDGSWGWVGGVTPSCTACSGVTHSYGGASCSVCAAGAAFVSFALSCTPSPLLTAGPADTALYLSGSVVEGVGAFSTISAPSGISYSTSVFGVPNGSLVLANGSFLSAAGGGAPASLPSAGNVSWSSSAWVKCAPPLSPWAAVLEWGAAGDAQGSASPQVAALVVASLASNVGPALVLRACDSTWHHVALTYAPASLSLAVFLDGAPELSISANIILPPAASSSLRVGFSGDLSTNGGSLFAGELLELRLYNRALSVTEVVALSQPPLTAYLAAFANTVVNPPVPVAAAKSYTFSCAASFVGQPATLQRFAADGSWMWAGGLEPLCSAPAAASALGPAAIAGIAVSSGVLLVVASCFACLWCRRSRINGDKARAARELDRSKLLALQAVPNAPGFVISFESGTVCTAEQLREDLSPRPPLLSLQEWSPAPVFRSTTTQLQQPLLGEAAPDAAPAAERFVELKWADIVPDLRFAPRFGGFGCVFVARWAPKRKLVAVKVLKSALLSLSQSQSAVEMLVHEAQGLVRASDGGANTHVVQVFGMCQGPAEGWRAAQRAARVAEERAEWRRRARVIKHAAGTAAHADADSDDEPSVLSDAAANDAMGAEGAVTGPAPFLFGLVMSYESGGSLNEALFPRSRGAASWPRTMLERLRVLREVATGLYQLHATGLVHGDLKLENVLLSSPEERRVRLADFGLATLRAAASGGADPGASRISTLAQADVKRGTYTYMAPEMFALRSAPGAAASRTTDVFAFGTLAWEVLASKHAWAGVGEADRVVALGRGESLSTAALPAETPNSVGALVARCLARERRERPRMAEAVAVLEQAHENLLSGRFDVFLSYCWGPRGAHKALADEVYLALRAAGLRVWLDEQEMGLDLQASMSEGIAKSDVVVVLVSPDYAASANCMHELREAVRMGKPLVACCAAPGSWRRWGLASDGSGVRAVGDDSELARLARLGTHLFVELGECSRVQWANEGAVSAAERRTLQSPDAVPRLLRLIDEARKALAAEQAAAAQRERELQQSLLGQAQAALEAATAARDAAAARLREAEALAGRRVAEAGRKAEQARQAHVAATAACALAAGLADADADEATDRLVACLAALRAAKAEEKRVGDAEALRVGAARAALAASARAREEAAAAFAAAQRG